MRRTVWARTERSGRVGCLCWESAAVSCDGYHLVTGHRQWQIQQLRIIR
jgi:hypothetical protein